MQFSDSIVYDNLALMAKEDAGYSSIDDLGDSKVGVQDATTSSEFAAEQGLTTVQFEVLSLLQQSLQAGQIEAGIANISLVLAVMQADDSVESLELFDTDEHLAAAVQTGGSPVLDEFNALLAEDAEDGSYDELVEEWFEDAADAAKVPAEELSKGLTGPIAQQHRCAPDTGRRPSRPAASACSSAAASARRAGRRR